MTKETARTLLIQIFNTYSNIITDNYKDGVIQEAFEMAIEALRKTENSSEKPNNCEDLQDWEDRMWAEAIVTEPTISKMEQVDKDINVRSKDEPQYDAEEVAKDINRRVEMVKKEWNARHIEDEPQTDCAWK